MPFGKARLRTCLHCAARAAFSCGVAAVLLFFGSRALQTAVAEGDTRTISLHHIHTNEDITITFKRDGRYDEAALEKLNWFLRDWRREQETRMDPHLIDLIWEVHRETGSQQPVWVVCGYRSPETNAMLRRRSRGVAKFSQHMLGRAMDFYIPGVPLEELRVIGLRLQRGGVGFYPTSGSPFVHMDTGSVRHWPRMTREQLVRVFPEGRTVHIPSDGRPLPGYALALADIRRHGGNPSDMSLEAAHDAGVNVGAVHGSTNAFLKLLGFGKHDEEDDADVTAVETTASTTPRQPLRTRAKEALVAAVEDAKDKVAAEKTKLVRLAKRAHVITRAEAAPAPAAENADSIRLAAHTPNEVILARGYWQGLPDGMTAARPTPAAALATEPRAHDPQVASADATAGIGPFAAPGDDRVSPQLALAYAEQPVSEQPAAERRVSEQPARAAPPRAVSRAIAVQSGDGNVTIAVKRIEGRPASAVLTVARKNTVAVEDPWLRAVATSPSVRSFLTTLALGDRDFTRLAALMVKPISAVMMTFSADPNLGLADDHFSGSAVVFMSTVTFYPTHTADLR